MKPEEKDKQVQWLIIKKEAAIADERLSSLQKLFLYRQVPE